MRKQWLRLEDPMTCEGRQTDTLPRSGNEQWRDIPGFEGMYQASTLGHVRSVDREVPRKGSTFRLKGRVLRPFASKTSGYLYVNLGSRHRIGVHTAVLSTFVSLRPEGKDGDPHNNVFLNLKWGTHVENEHHKRKHGTLNNGSRNGSSKLSRATVLAIRRAYADGGVRLEDLAACYGVTESAIGYVIRRKTWTHIDDDGNTIPPDEQVSYHSRLIADRHRRFSAHGKLLSMKEWSVLLDVATGTLWARLRRGWSVDRTFADS